MILYHVYYAFMPSITYIWITFAKTTFSKSIIFKVKSTFEPNVFKCVIKIVFISSSPFSLLIFNVRILSNFQKEWCTFGRKKNVFSKNKDCSFSMFECFEHAIFLIYLCQVLNMQNLQLMQNIPKYLWQSKLLCCLCDISNMQKCSFKECPLTQVVPLTVILPREFILFMMLN